MSIHDAIKVATRFVESQQEIWLPALQDKAEKVAQAFPNDPTCVSMSQVLTKRASKTNLISRAEFNQLYQQTWTPNNKFSQHFEGELGLERIPEAKAKEFKDPLPKVEADPTYLHAFNSFWDKKATYQAPAALKKEVMDACRITLKNLATPARSLEVVAANADWMICRAGFETPKGETAILIPVETKDSQVSLPNQFAHSVGWVELTTDLLQNHLKTSAGRVLEAKADQLLKSLTKQATAPLNAVDVAIMKAKLAKVASASEINDIGVQYKQAFTQETEVPRAPETEETRSFSAQLATHAGAACVMFSKATVEKGRELVARSLLNLGYTAQVGVAGSTKDTITYAASIANQGFRVPVKVANGLPTPPQFAFMNGSMADFSSAGIGELLSEGSDQQAHKAASTLGNAGDGNVVAALDRALANQHWEKAEDALSVLSQGDPDLYRVAFQAYQQALSGKLVKTAETKCAAPRKDRNHLGEVCSHTGLPVDQVYQDKFGQCRPLHRRGREASSEDQMCFLNSRIVLNG